MQIWKKGKNGGGEVQKLSVPNSQSDNRIKDKQPRPPGSDSKHFTVQQHKSGEEMCTIILICQFIVQYGCKKSKKKVVFLQCICVVIQGHSFFFALQTKF